MIMQKMDGSLEDFYPLTEDNASTILRACVSLMARCVRELRINYRNVKLGNFFYSTIDCQPIVKLGDYGISKTITPDEDVESILLNNLHTLLHTYLNTSDFIRGASDPTNPQRIIFWEAFRESIVKELGQKEWTDFLKQHSLKDVGPRFERA
jgi:serine/threonine protein kinase